MDDLIEPFKLVHLNVLVLGLKEKHSQQMENEENRAKIMYVRKFRKKEKKEIKKEKNTEFESQTSRIPRVR